MPHARRGFTLTDLVIALVIVALVAPVVLQLAYRDRETVNRVQCGNNLRQIGQGMLIYANENRRQYPRTIYQPGAPPTQYTGADAANPFGLGGPAANDVTAVLYLLLRTQDLTSEIFVCPSTPAKAWNFAGKRATDFSNFPGEQNLGYSLANPYFDEASVTTRGPFGNADYAVAADMNPGTLHGSDVTGVTAASSRRDLARGNSRNHQSSGQNVLYGDGHVEFQQTAAAGVRGDNIYTVSGSEDGSVATSTTIIGTPRWQGDSVLLPVAALGPDYTAAPRTPGVSLVEASGVILVAAAALVVLRMWRAGRRARGPA